MQNKKIKYLTYIAAISSVAASGYFLSKFFIKRYLAKQDEQYREQLKSILDSLSRGDYNATLAMIIDFVPRNNADLARIASSEACCHYMLANNTLAFQALEKAISKMPISQEVSIKDPYYKLAVHKINLLRLSEKYDEAITEIKLLSERVVKPDINLKFLHGMVLYKLKDFEKAVEELKIGLESPRCDWPDLKINFVAVNQRYLAKQDEQYREQLKSILDSLSRGDYNATLAIINDFVPRNNADLARIASSEACCHYMLANNTLAFQALEKAISKMPISQEVSIKDPYYKLAVHKINLLRLSEKYDEAITEIKLLSERVVKPDINLKFLHGMVLYKLKDFEKAVEELKIGLESPRCDWPDLKINFVAVNQRYLAKQDEQYREQLKSILDSLSRGDYNATLAIINDFVPRNNADLARIASSEACCHYMLANNTLAFQALEKAISKMPISQEVSIKDPYYKLAVHKINLLRLSEKYDEAITEIKLLSERVAKPDMDLKFLHGMVLYKLKDFEKAVEELKIGIESPRCDWPDLKINFVRFDEVREILKELNQKPIEKNLMVDAVPSSIIKYSIYRHPKGEDAMQEFLDDLLHNRLSLTLGVIIDLNNCTLEQKNTLLTLLKQEINLLLPTLIGGSIAFNENDPLDRGIRNCFTGKEKKNNAEVWNLVCEELKSSDDNVPILKFSRQFKALIEHYFSEQNYQKTVLIAEKVCHVIDYCLNNPPNKWAKNISYWQENYDDGIGQLRSDLKSIKKILITIVANHSGEDSYFKSSDVQKYFLARDCQAFAALAQETLALEKHEIIPTDITSEIIGFCPIGEGGNFWLYS